LETEKITLSLLVETSFYPAAFNQTKSIPEVGDTDAIMDALLKNPMLAQQVLQLFQVHAVTE